jgi:hypothetical protein
MRGVFLPYVVTLKARGAFVRRLGHYDRVTEQDFMIRGDMRAEFARACLENGYKQPQIHNALRHYQPSAPLLERGINTCVQRIPLYLTKIKSENTLDLRHLESFLCDYGEIVRDCIRSREMQFELLLHESKQPGDSLKCDTVVEFLYERVKIIDELYWDSCFRDVGDFILPSGENSAYPH